MTIDIDEIAESEIFKVCLEVFEEQNKSGGNDKSLKDALAFFYAMGMQQILDSIEKH